MDLKIKDKSFAAPLWDELATAQREKPVQPQHIINSSPGTVFAFKDRDNFTEAFGRKIFVVRGDEDDVYLFGEDGTVLDEPASFTPGGVQRYPTIPAHTHIILPILPSCDYVLAPPMPLSPAAYQYMGMLCIKPVRRHGCRRARFHEGVG